MKHVNCSTDSANPNLVRLVCDKGMSATRPFPLFERPVVSNDTFVLDKPIHHLKLQPHDLLFIEFGFVQRKVQGTMLPRFLISRATRLFPRS